VSSGVQFLFPKIIYPKANFASGLSGLVVVVVALSWVKAEPLYPHHNYILG